jgi:hypothetical protein
VSYPPVPTADEVLPYPPRPEECLHAPNNASIRNLLFKRKSKPQTLTLRCCLGYSCTCYAPPLHVQPCSRWAARPRTHCHTHLGLWCVAAQWCAAAPSGSARGRHHVRCYGRGCRGCRGDRSGACEERHGSENDRCCLRRHGRTSAINCRRVSSELRQ